MQQFLTFERAQAAAETRTFAVDSLCAAYDAALLP
jgi:hypothetical protein